MILLLALPISLAICYLCWKIASAIRSRYSMGNVEWLGRKLASDARFESADAMYNDGKKAFAFNSKLKQIYLAKKDAIFKKKAKGEVCMTALSSHAASLRSVNWVMSIQRSISSNNIAL